MEDIIDKTYLPFTTDELKPHFLLDFEGQIKYYRESAYRYHEFMEKHPKTDGIPLKAAMIPRQIEKDERFWTITATKSIYDHQSRTNMLKQLLIKAFGLTPAIANLDTWEKCLDGDLQLYNEAWLPLS